MTPRNHARSTFLLMILFLFFFVISKPAFPQSATSTSISGTVLDPSGAVVPNATVEIVNPVSAFSRTAVTDAAGKFVVPNVPFNPYHLTVNAAGFSPYVQDVDVRSSLPINLAVKQAVLGLPR